MRQALRIWGLAAALAAGIAAAVEWTDRPPPPRAADAPVAEFSEARALPVLRHLTEAIGLRTIGSAGGEAAAAHLVEVLREMPGIEVEVQEATTTDASPFRGGAVAWYRARNVLARIPGVEPTAVLVSGHYDSPPESVGAGDDGIGVASMVEVARALAAGPRLRHTVIFNFNDGEEAGLLGAAAFAAHPWIRDVRAFVNLESAGPRGKAILFQAGPGNAWLARAYARSAPHPYGSVLAQDIFQGGLIPSDTDFRVYRDAAGLRGLDLATFQDGYAYHTALDRIERIEPGTIQHMGANALALVRELAGGDLPGDTGAEPAVYYDVLGLTMLVYDAGTARLLALAALLLAAAALGLALRRRALTVTRLLAGLTAATLGTVGGLLAAAAGALATAYLLGKPHAWYAGPGIAIAAYGAAALAGALGVHALWARFGLRRGASGADRGLALWAGAVLLWAAALLWLTWRGFGAAYLALWWTAPAALGLAVAVVRPAWRGAAHALAVVPGAVLTLQAAVLLLKLAVPIAGRFPAPVPFDPFVAAIVAVPFLATAVVGLAAIHPVGHLGRAAGATGAFALVALAVLALQFPYSPERPKRLLIDHSESERGARLTIYGLDFPPLSAALAGIEGFELLPGAPPRNRFVRAGPAEATGLPAPRVAITPGGGTTPDGARRVGLRIEPGTFHYLQLEIPAARLAAWSIAAPLPQAPADGEILRVRIFSAPDTGWAATFDLRGAAPVPVVVRARYAPATTPLLGRLLEQLPAWTTPATVVTRTRRLEL